MTTVLKAMKTTLIVMALLLTSAGVLSKAPSLSVEVTLTEGEHSRDSNSTTTSITLRGRRLHYVKSHAGYRSGRQPPLDKSVVVPEVDLERIRHLLAEKDLLTSRSSISPTDQAGSYVEIEARIGAHKKKSTLKFAAMRKEADRDSLYAGLRALVDELEQIVNP